jgi:hypothetical protein
VGVNRLRGLCAAGAAATVTLALLVGAAPAAASEVGEHVATERRLEKRITQITRAYHRRSRVLRAAVALAQRDAEDRPGRQTLRVMRRARHVEWRLDRNTHRRLDSLEVRLDDTRSWLYSWGIFRVCPVDEPRFIHDDFGEIVTVGSVAPHVHMGNDIEAPLWTPIRAPFDGYAWSSYSTLGGYQVRVRNDRGYVFNGHLIGYGRLGWVNAGTIIGYVGSTGLSTAPHDHFEWHPWNGGAVDPQYLLRLSCG